MQLLRELRSATSTHATTSARTTTSGKNPMTCSTRTTWKTLTRSGAIVVVFGLGVATSGVSYAADTGTVRALIRGDGSVSSLSRLGGDSNTRPTAANLPITLGISASDANGARTTTYHVENKTSRTEPVSITQPNGTTKTVQQEIQTPYVAQLHLALPGSLTEVVAPGAAVVTNSDGSHDLTWSLVLFSPIGTPAQDVSFTAKGKGNPVARLESTAVSPNGTPGLSATGQAANATIAGNGTLNAVTAAANSGLTQLAAGVGQLVAGLESLKSGADQLHTGLATGADGTNKLATGLHSAHDGSGKLDTGLGQLNAGTGKLVAGTNALHDGSDKLVAGLQKASDGSKQLVGGSEQLATGAGLTADGATRLSTGLQQISGGLGQLGASSGLPAAKVGALALQAGVTQISAGLGSPNANGTILDGLAKVGNGLGVVKGGLDQLAGPAGLPAAKGGVDAVITGLNTTKAAVDGPLLLGVDTIRKGLASGAATGGGVDQLNQIFQLAAKKLTCPLTPPGTPSKTTTGCEDLRTGIYLIDHDPSAGDPTAGLKQQTQAGANGLAAVSKGLRSGSTSSDPTTFGVSEALGASSAGLGQISLGLTKAITGVGELDAAVGTPVDAGTLSNGVALLNGGVERVAIGIKSGNPAHPGILEGLDALVAGLTSAITGVNQLSAGATSAATGSAALADGTRQVAAGANKLSETGAEPISGGLGQLLAGGQKLNAGAGQLNSGAGQLNTGAGAAHTGSSALNDGLAKISAGEDKLAAGLPAAVTGSGQISDGAGKLLAGDKAVGAGLAGVKSKATSVLASQLSSGTENSKLQLAGLEATTARLASDPAANTAYVLTQEGSTSGLKLAGNQSHVGRNIGLGVGGLLLLLAGLAVGFFGGRRRKVA